MGPIVHDSFKKYAVSRRGRVRRLFLELPRRFGYPTSINKIRWPISAPVTLPTFRADLMVLLVVFDKTDCRVIRFKSIRRLFSSSNRATWVSYFRSIKVGLLSPSYNDRPFWAELMIKSDSLNFDSASLLSLRIAIWLFYFTINW